MPLRIDEYDADGNLASSTFVRGSVRTVEVCPRQRFIRVTWADGRREHWEVGERGMDSVLEQLTESPSRPAEERGNDALRKGCDKISEMTDKAIYSLNMALYNLGTVFPKAGSSIVDALQRLAEIRVVIKAIEQPSSTEDSSSRS